MLLARPALAALALACAGCAVPPGTAPVPSDPPPFGAPVSSPQSVERGRAMAAARCGGCHAVGLTGDSPLAAAPPLRDVANLYPPEQLQEAFAEGVMTGHPAMPQFELPPGEINDLIAWLDSMRTE
ncbi:cytochrome c [Brevundimonas sp.]|uniref:c-type cytochrome n=1 Tax=Brevundimonas sp. TaxID=1871086 RepID=UPI0027F924F6|nr:cytochrome c [Brevundimonas sp.]MDQ7811078.1 cytochrome c [Brevundimonas sp.]